MAKVLSPIEGFIDWLPGELQYSARKAGYDKKLKRAALATNDPQSMYGFLGQEWYDFVNLGRQGAYYQPSHGKSAQAAIVKLAAGFFDKQAMGNWLASGKPATPENFADIAHATAQEVIDIAPWKGLGIVKLADDFDDTPFGECLPSIMSNLVLASTIKRSPERTYAIDQVKIAAQICGGIATGAYVTFAEANLDPAQYVIPNSALVN